MDSHDLSWKVIHLFDLLVDSSISVSIFRPILNCSHVFRPLHWFLVKRLACDENSFSSLWGELLRELALPWTGAIAEVAEIGVLLLPSKLFRRKSALRCAAPQPHPTPQRAWRGETFNQVPVRAFQIRWNYAHLPIPEIFFLLCCSWKLCFDSFQLWSTEMIVFVKIASERSSVILLTWLFYLGREKKKIRIAIFMNCSLRFFKIWLNECSHVFTHVHTCSHLNRYGMSWATSCSLRLSQSWPLDKDSYTCFSHPESGDEWSNFRRRVRRVPWASFSAVSKPIQPKH